MCLDDVPVRVVKKEEEKSSHVSCFSHWNISCKSCSPCDVCFPFTLVRFIPSHWLIVPTNCNLSILMDDMKGEGEWELYTSLFMTLFDDWDGIRGKIAHMWMILSGRKGTRSKRVKVNHNTTHLQHASPSLPDQMNWQQENVKQDQNCTTAWGKDERIRRLKKIACSALTRAVILLLIQSISPSLLVSRPEKRNERQKTSERKDRLSLSFPFA